MTNALTKKEVIEEFKLFNSKDLFCPDCLNELILQNEGTY